MKNSEVAERLLEIADLLDVLGERFKPEAYRRAARSIEAMVEGVEQVAARGALREVPGIGEAIDGKIQELLRTGTIPYLEKLRREVPPGLRELVRLPGLGPKTARRFWTEFGIEGPAELAAAIRDGKLAGAKGFGERKIAQLGEALAQAAAGPSGARVPLEAAYPPARAILDALRGSPDVDRVAIAGSFRRGRESVGDLDILVTSERPESVFDLFSHLPEVREVRLRGPTKETVVLSAGLQVDLRVVEPDAFGAALQYFTGSKDHNVRLRSLARDQGLKINEYGVFRGDARIGGKTEEELYGLLGLAWIPPELREDRGEIALAAAHRLPTLVESSDLRGDLHVHLPEPAGLRELDHAVAQAQRLKLGYLGIVVARVEHGALAWSAPRATVARVREAADGGIRTVAAVETDRTGELPEDLGVSPGVLVLRAGPGDAGPTAATPPTRRATVVAHLTGREGPEADRTLELARSVSAAVEVGPGADRADSTFARAARDARVPLAVATGAGEPPGNPTLEVALAFARRAGARAEEVANARGIGPVRRAARPARR